MDERIVARISREANIDNLLDVLAGVLTPTDLQSLLLEVYRRRAAHVSPPRLVERYENDRFVQRSPIDPLLLLELDRLSFSSLPPGYEPVELSPVAPLGTVTALTGPDQNLVVSTVRNTEVVSDSTNVLALECARRRRVARSRPVKLCASHRLLRGQLYAPGWNAHFRLLGLCAAGRAGCELEGVVEQLALYLRLLGSAAVIGLHVPGVRVSLTPLDERSAAAAAVEELSAAFPDVHVELDAERAGGRGYYAGTCFHIHAREGTGEDVQLVDGGFTGWTQALLNDRKERLLISGLGSELLCSRFATGGRSPG